MLNETHLASPRYKISDFFSSLLGVADHRLGKYWRFRAADVLAWIERQRVGGRAGA